MTNPVLTVAGLGLGRGGRPMLADVSFSLEEGCIAAVLGPSGAGKTTMLRLVAGLEAPTEGEVRFREGMASRPGIVLLPPRSRGIGFAPQGHSLWPHLDVFENVAFPLRARGIGDVEIRARVTESLEALGILGLARRKPSEISGGEQQRTALARALIHRPRLVLLDEPLTGLDAQAREGARRALIGALRRTGAAALFVTHDHDDARGVADRILVVRDGRLVQDGVGGEVWRRPISPEVAALLGATTSLEARANGGRAEFAGGVSLSIEPGVVDGTLLTVLFRPEDFLCSDAAPGWEVVVRTCVPRDDSFLIEADSPAGTLLVRTRLAHPVGGTVKITPAPGNPKCYQHQTNPRS